MAGELPMAKRILTSSEAPLVSVDYNHSPRFFQL